MSSRSAVHLSGCAITHCCTSASSPSYFSVELPIVLTCPLAHLRFQTTRRSLPGGPALRRIPSATSSS